MSIVIYKYPLAVELQQHVAMPKGSRMLGVGAQGSEAVLWAECDDGEDYIGRRIAVVMTGQEPPKDAAYVGTFQILEEGLPPFVGHVYDGGEFTVEQRIGDLAS